MAFVGVRYTASGHAPVAQWIEYRPPKPVAGVRVSPGAPYHDIFGGLTDPAHVPASFTIGAFYDFTEPLCPRPLPS
jgi:hypothetical protein